MKDAGKTCKTEVCKRDRKRVRGGGGVELVRRKIDKRARQKETETQRQVHVHKEIQC